MKRKDSYGRALVLFFKDHCFTKGGFNSEVQIIKILHTSLFVKGRELNYLDILEQDFFRMQDVLRGE
jgi:hypothetical protein